MMVVVLENHLVFTPSGSTKYLNFIVQELRVVHNSFVMVWPASISDCMRVILKIRDSSHPLHNIYSMTFTGYIKQVASASVSRMYLRTWPQVNSRYGGIVSVWNVRLKKNGDGLGKTYKIWMQLKLPLVFLHVRKIVIKHYYCLNFVLVTVNQ